MKDDSTNAPAAVNPATAAKPRRFLPRLGSPAYHVMLTCVAIIILGPLRGISAAFMNFSIGFFVDGQVLAGILGSTVTLPYGPDGKHGANYMQTMAASVAGMAAMAPLVQAMVWMGLPVPPAWQLILYFLCIGMFGVGIGMLYTPILVDRLRLTYLSGLAVANILRALTDRDLLRQSIAKLGGSTLAGYLGGLATTKIAALGATGLSLSTLGGGLIVGARVAIPALVVALIGLWLTPHVIELHWLGPRDHYRKIGFVVSLGGILGVAALDLAIILVQTVRRLWGQRGAATPPAEDWKRVNMLRLVLWVAGWGIGTVWLGSRLLHQPVFFLLVAVGLCFIVFQKPRPMAVGVGLCPCTIAYKLFAPLWGPSKSPVLCTGLFTGDGAAWIWELRRLNFPNAIEILDLYHALEHLHLLCDGLYGPQSPWACKMKATWTEMFKNDQVAEVIASARRRLKDLGSEADQSLDTQIAYFEHHQHRMRYKSYRQARLFYGSGVVEAGCRAVIGQRLKNSGMFWTESGARSVLNLRCALKSNRWDECWDRLHDSKRLRIRAAA
jgi:hypothetical protein